MIRVVYLRDYHRVSVEGHAKSAEKGKDLICASASILTYTLANFVKAAEKEGQMKCCLASLEAGDAIISCTPYEDYRSSATAVFDAICGGFELLARDYPDNISYEVVGKSI